LAWALLSDTRNRDSLEADYGSLKKAIEGLQEESRNLESQTKPIEAERNSINIPKHPNEVTATQEHATLASLIRAARGEKVEVD
jgi:hypothetical protein